MAYQIKSSLRNICSVLLTEGDYSSTVGIMRYLDKKGIETWAISPHKRALSSYSKYCRKCFISPQPLTEREYISFIKGVIKANNIDMLIPVGYQSCYTAAKYQEELRKVVALEVPKLKSVEMALDKKETYKLAQRTNVPYPRTVYPADIHDIEDLAQQIGYPVIIKGLYEAGRNIVSLVEDKDALVSKYAEICEQNGFEPGSLPMLQEYIPGQKTDFVTISLLYQRGECKRLFMQRRIRNMDKLGTATCCDCNIPPDVAQQMKNNAQVILDALEWHGVACIEFKRDPRDEIVKLIEINPKFWASTEMSLTAGVNFPFYLCQMADGEQLDYSEEYNHNLKFHFPLSGDLRQLRWNPKSIPDYIFDILNPKVKSNVNITDLKPNVIEFGRTLISMLLGIIPRKGKQWAKSTLN